MFARGRSQTAPTYSFGSYSSNSSLSNRLYHNIRKIAKEKGWPFRCFRIKMIGLIWWSRGESIQSRLRSVEPHTINSLIFWYMLSIAYTDRWPASCNRWNLPRTKKCPPDTFYTSVRTGAVLSIPFLGSTIRKNRPKAVFLWWSRGESNPCPKATWQDFLRAQFVIYIPFSRREQTPCGNQ